MGIGGNAGELKLTSPAQVRTVLAELDIQPRKEWGQNFLIDANIRNMIVEIAALGADDVVLEIGAGLGVLTEVMLVRAARVVAVEKDRRLAAHLAERFGWSPRLQLISGDFMDLDAATLLNQGISKVVGNLPYSVGSRMLVNLFFASTPPAQIVVTVQLEVAERLAAGPGDSPRGLLSVWAQLAYEVRVRKTVSATCFYPRPDVQSAIVQMTRRPAPVADLSDRGLYYDVTREAFRYRRKQLTTILARAPGRLRRPADQAAGELQGLGIDPRSRPEDLTVEDWCRLAGRLAAPGAAGEACA